MNFFKTLQTSIVRALRSGILPLVFGLYGGIALSANEASTLHTLDLSTYRGKVVVVDFWASWCTPCRRSIPWLNDMQARYSERGLVVLGINTDTLRSDAERFMDSVPAHFPVMFDPEGKLAATYKLPGMPTSMIFDRQGHLLRTHVGFREAERALREQEIVSLLENGK